MFVVIVLELKPEEQIKCIFDDNSEIILPIHKNLCCGCSLESPRQGDSNEHSQHRFNEELTKITFQLSSNINK